MTRLIPGLALVIGLLAGALGYSMMNQPAPQTDEAAVRAIVASVLAEDAAKAPPEKDVALDAATLNPMIENYLMGNPRILERVSNALQDEMRTAQRAEAKEQIASLQHAIFEDPNQIVVGNPKGDVTLVEMFDYNCGYCRQALPALATLIAEDPNLRVILKEFPILSQESIDAARIAVVVGKSDVDYWDFHQQLFTARGQVNGTIAMAAAQKLGLNPVTVSLDAQSDDTSKEIQKSYEIAKQLNITGTPTYIIGDELIPGAVGIEELRTRIANMRACGSTECDKDPA